MREEEQLQRFFDRTDENGVSNREKVARYQKIIRRLPTTDKSRSYEAAEGKNAAAGPADGLPEGVVVEDGKLIGFGIHIFNEDVYPLRSFEIYFRGCELTGELDLTNCGDLVFLDVYHNKIDHVATATLPKMRIFGVQDNRITALDTTGMPACQGIDAGRNRLAALDVGHNPELVELYINDNDFTSIDLTGNPKLKYFYCHHNRITALDTRANPLLRHLNAADNPMQSIRALAPQRDEPLPLELYAGEGGSVGLQFHPVYDAQWKETGLWEQRYFAYPDGGRAFDGWWENGEKVSDAPVWTDDYGASRILTARFVPAPDRS